jgi:WD40 repeat protein
LIAPITALEFADNERAIASQTAAQFAYAWDAPAGNLLSPLMDHQAAIRSVAFPDGEKDLFSSGIDGKAYRWNYATGALGEEIAFRPARIPGQPLVRPVVNLSIDGVRAVWPKAPVAEVFDVGTGDNLYVIPPPSSPPAPVNINFSQDGWRVAMVSPQAGGKRTGICEIWDLKRLRRIAELETPTAVAGQLPGAIFDRAGERCCIVAFANSPQGFQVLTLVGYDLKNNKKLATVEDPAASGSITLSIADDNTVIAASTSGRMWSMDYVTGQVGEDFDTLVAKGEAPVYGPIAISPDGKRFATGIVGEPFTTYGIRVYDVATKKKLHTFIGHAGPVSSIHFSRDGQRIASGAQDTSVLLWDLANPGREK